MGSALQPSTADDRAVLQIALSAYFASQQFAILGGAYVERSLIPGAVLWMDASRPLPHLVAWMSALAWAGCATLGVSFEILAWRARQRLTDALPLARRAVRLHFAPAPAPSVSSLLLRPLLPLGAVLAAHALQPDLLPWDVVFLGARCWAVLLVLWLALRTAARSLTSSGGRARW